MRPSSYAVQWDDNNTLWKKFDPLFVNAYNTSFSSLQAYNLYEWTRPLCLTDTQQLGGTFTFTYALPHQ